MLRTRWRNWSAGCYGLSLVLLATAFITGCGEDSPAGTESQNEAAELAYDLSLEDGGIDAGDEAPGFGDPYFESYLAEAEPALDPLESDARFRGLEDDPRADVFFVQITWGNLSGSPEETGSIADVVYDWTGYAEVSDGVMIPRRVIRFERGDSLVRTDRDRQKVAWISHTSPHWDGVLLQVVVPAADDNTLAEARGRTAGDGLTPDDTFAFVTPLFEMTFPLAEMAAIEETFDLGDGLGVTFSGFTRDDLGDACPKGPMAGAWVKVPDDERNGGFFRAQWTNAIGGLFGHVRGRWGTTEEGEQVFVGKIIARNGHYLGHVRGTWERNADDSSRGTMAGQWVVYGRNEEPRAHGGVRGEWATADDGEHGRLRGMWGADCSGVDDEGEAE